MRRMYPVCASVFASWDFHVVDGGAVRGMRRTLRSQLREMISDVSRQEVYVSDSARLLSKMRKVACLACYNLISLLRHNGWYPLTSPGNIPPYVSNHTK